MANFLVVTWDGGGNVSAALSVARGLAARGHDVRLLGHAAIHRRCDGGKWRRRTFSRTADLDSAVTCFSEPEELTFLVDELMMSSTVARDVSDELGAEPADVIVADSMLLGALSAGEAAGVPTVALFTTAFSLFRAGPFVDALNPSIAALNALRSDLGIPAVAGPWDVHDACSLCLVASLSEFEPVDRFPPNVRFIGPLVDAPALLTGPHDPPPAAGSEALVVVSFSTSGQRQGEPLQRVADALGDLPVEVLVTTGPAVDPGSIRARPNTQVVEFVPHRLVVSDASLVVTHAGMGTTMTALANGVPLVCMPMGRDQFFNAARVEALGAGITIGIDTDTEAIREAVRHALEDPDLRCNARHLAAVAATYEGESDAVTRVEALC